MNVLVDMWAVHPLTGVFRYGVSLIAELSRSPGVRIEVATSRANYSAVRNFFSSSAQVEIVSVPSDRKVLRTEPYLDHYLEEGHFDAYYTPDYLLSQHVSIPAIVTIHDAIRLKHYSRAYSDNDIVRMFGGDELQRMQARVAELLDHGIVSRKLPVGSTFLQWFDMETRFSIARATYVVTPSYPARAEILSYWPQASEKISVLHGGVDPYVFRPRARTERASVLRGINVNEDYVLFVGGAVRGHKRIDILNEFFTAALSLRPQLRLVIVAHGEVREDAFVPLGDHLHNGKVLIIGPITDDELACLYSGASGVLVVSEDEGYCLPAREALACGATVLSPHLAVLRDLPRERCFQVDLGSDSAYLQEVWERIFRVSPEANCGVDSGTWNASASALRALMMSLRSSRSQ